LELLGVALELADLVDDLADAIDVELLVELGLVLVDVLDDVLDADLALAQALADLEQFLDGDRAVEHGLQHLALAVLDALGDLDLALAGEQRDRAHLAQVHADGVARARVRVLLVLVDLFLLVLFTDAEAFALRRLIDDVGAAAARAVDDLDAVIAERRQPAVDLIGRHDVLGHRVVDLVVRDEALLLAELDQLVLRASHRVGVAAGTA